MDRRPRRRTAVSSRRFPFPVSRAFLCPVRCWDPHTEAFTMSKRRTGYWLLAASALALAVLAAPRLARGDRDDTDKLLDHYLRAYNNGDPAALAELYTEDALFLPHERSIVRGREGI